MRWLIPLALLTSACGERRSFDERFNDTASEIEERARNLDQQLNEQANEQRPREESPRDPAAAP